MATNFRRIYNGATLEPQGTDLTSELGDIQARSDLNKITLNNGSSASPIVTEAHTATLTNKTLSGNTASSLVNGSGTFNFNSSGTLTAPNATDTLVGKATTDVLTNKTLSGNTATSLINGSGTFNFNSSGTVTAPNATDTLVGKATTDTFTNKSIDGSTNTLSNIAEASLATVLGNANNFLVRNGSGVIVSNTKVVPTGAVVGTTDSQTLTNKVLSGNTASSLVNGSGTLNLNSSGTVTVPNATDTLVAKATADTLSNKTFSDSIVGAQIATPANPSAGFDKLYFKSDDNLYILNSAGVESNISGGASNVTAVQTYLNNANQGYVDQSALMTATTSTGSPAAGNFYSGITNRAPMVDFLQDLKPRMGTERHMTNELYGVHSEFGPAGQKVYGITNDFFGRFRAVGLWTETNGSNGQFITTSTSGDFIEFTFLGTGCNALVTLSVASQNAVVSIDGGSDSANIFSTPYEALRAARNTAVNQKINLATGLTYGVHTVRLKQNTTVALNVYGFESVNESTTVTVSKGIGYIAGQKYTTGSAQTFSYSAPVTGSKGGRVLVYQNSDGTISQAFTATLASANFLGSTSHVGEEISEIYYARQFGNGGSIGDFGNNSLSNSNVMYVLDDGVTSLKGGNTSISTLNGFESVTISNSTGNLMTLTFIGTGLDIEQLNSGTASGAAVTVSVDGVSQGTSTTTTSNGPVIIPICSGLAYGTHVVEFKVSTTNTSAFGITRFIVYQPSTPALPANKVSLGTYNALATFVANSSATLNTMSTGVIRKQNYREQYANISTSASINVAHVSGFDIAYCASGDYVALTFEGTGFDHRFTPTTATTAPNLTMTIDGLAPSTANFASIAGSFYGNVSSFSVGSSGTGAIVTTATATANHSGIYVTGLPYGIHTVKLALTNSPSCGSGWTPGSFDIITPIWSPKLHNGLYASAPGILDARKTTSLTAPGANRKGYMCILGTTSGPTIASSNFSPVADMHGTLETIGGNVTVDFTAEMGTGGTVINLALYVDGIPYGQTFVQGTASNLTIGAHWQLTNLPAGKHQIAIWCNNNGTGSITFIAQNRQLTAIEL